MYMCSTSPRFPGVLLGGSGTFVRAPMRRSLVSEDDSPGRGSLKEVVLDGTCRRATHHAEGSRGTPVEVARDRGGRQGRRDHRARGMGGVREGARLVRPPGGSGARSAPGATGVQAPAP